MIVFSSRANKVFSVTFYIMFATHSVVFYSSQYFRNTEKKKVVIKKASSKVVSLGFSV